MRQGQAAWPAAPRRPHFRSRFAFRNGRFCRTTLHSQTGFIQFLHERTGIRASLFFVDKFGELRLIYYHRETARNGLFAIHPHRSNQLESYSIELVGSPSVSIVYV